MAGLLSLTDIQRSALDRARQVIQDEIAPIASRIEETETFPELELRNLGRHGMLGAPLPVEYGGSGLDFVVYVEVLREMARVSGAMAATVDAHTTMVARPIQRFGSEAQRQRYLPALAAGTSIGAFALTEPGVGSDVAGIETRAIREGENYVLNGHKALIANANHADVVLVAASTSPERGAMGLSVFVVEANAEGLRRTGKRERTLGMRGTDIGEFILDELRVPVSSLLGREGFGMKVLQDTLIADRIATAAIALGLAETAQAHSLRYARERTQGGKPIAQFQSVKNMLADMEVGIAATRLLVRDAAIAVDQGQDASRSASVAKLFASEAAMRIAKDAIQIFGGWGYLRDFPVERLLRDAKHTELVDGTSEIQRIIIADESLRHGGPRRAASQLPSTKRS